MNYDILRAFADSWGLLFLVVLFIGAVLFAFRPSAKKNYEEFGKIPLKSDED